MNYYLSHIHPLLIPFLLYCILVTSSKEYGNKINYGQFLGFTAALIKKLQFFQFRYSSS